MNQFHLRNVFSNPRRNLVRKITLPVKNQWLQLLAIDVAADDATVNKIDWVEKFAAGKRRNISDVAAALFKFFVKIFIV